MVMERLKFSKKGKPCPSCASSDAFFGLIIDGSASETAGKCFSCGQFFPPQSVDKKEFMYRFEQEQEPYKVSDLEFSELQTKSLNFNNNFIIGLLSRDTNYVKILKKYNVVAFSENVVGFPYIALNGDIRSIKKIEYLNNLKRNRENKFSISWYHYGKTTENQYFKYCFFGEHLLKTKFKYVGIVESEKTAIIASVFFPDVLFLASGSKSTLANLLTINLLKKKRVIFFPDADAYDNWVEVSKKWAFPNNWRFADICKQLTDKNDIADELLINKNFAEKIRENINETFGKKINIAENIYYTQILRNWTARDIELMFDRYEISDIIVKFEKEEDSKRRSVKFYNSDKENIFFTEAIGDFLTDFCVDYQVINYNYLIEEKFTLKDVKSRIVERICYSKSFFGDTTYDVSSHTFNNMNFRENIENRLLNFSKTSLFAGDLPKSEVFDISQSAEAKHNKTLLVEFDNKSLGYFNEILTRGKAYCEKIGNPDEYYADILHELYSIKQIDYECLVLFCAAAQKLKLYGDPEFMRALIIVGAGGIGKDYILTSFILGEFRKYSQLYYDGSEKGVTNFSTLTPEVANKILINIISDDIEGLNKSVKLDNVTNELYKIENKGVDIKQVSRRFLTVATTNKKNVLFSKDDDTNAFARRFLLLDLQKTASVESYKNLTMFFVDNKEIANDFFSGWFYYINTLLNEKVLLQNLYLNTYNYMVEKKQELTYITNDDEVICDDFYEKIKALEDGSFNKNLELVDNVVYIFSLKKLARFLCLGKFSSETVKKAILLRYNDLLKLNTKRRVYGKVTNVAMQINDFEAFCNREFEVDFVENNEKKEFINLIKIEKK